MKSPIKFSLAIFCLTLSACSAITRSTWQEPKVDLPKQWEIQSKQNDSTQKYNETWWNIFGDEKLNNLIEDVLKSNNDLAAAALRVKRARLQSNLTNTNITPDITLGGSTGTTRDLRRNIISAHDYKANASLNYELDIWGKLAADRDKTSFEAAAVEYDRQAVKLSLIGTTATLYWQISFLNQNISNQQANINSLEETLKISQIRFKAGKTSELEVIQAQQDLSAQKASIIQLKQQLDEARHALAILFDRPPQYRFAELDELPEKTLPAIHASIPAKILNRRPDLRAANMRLHKALANIDQTRLSFLPSFNLTGSLGSSSIALSNVIRDPIGTLGVGLTLPFIQWNTMKLNINISQNEYAEDIINFRQTLYKSLSEVENSLAANQHYQQQKIYFSQSLEQAKQAESIAKIRYLAGKTDLQTYLNQQTTRRKAELSLAQNQFNLLSNRMKLMQALGGADN